MANVTINNNLSDMAYTRNAADFIYITADFVISLLIIMINIALVILFILQRRRLLKTPTNILLLSFWICNTLNGIGVILITTNFVVPGFDNPTSSPVAMNYRIFTDLYVAFLVKTVVMHFCGLTLDRYVFIFLALRYKSVMTANNVKRFLVIAWILPLIASFIQLVYLYKLIEANNGEELREKLDLISHVEIWYSMTTFAVFLAIPLSLLAVAYIMMFLEIRRLVKDTPPQQTRTEDSNKQRKVVYVFGTMYMMFVLLAMPYFTLRVVIDFYYYQWQEEVNPSQHVLRLVLTLKHLTSIAIPVFYTATSPDIRGHYEQFRRKMSTKISGHKSYFSFTFRGSGHRSEIELRKQTTFERTSSTCATL